MLRLFKKTDERTLPDFSASFIAKIKAALTTLRGDFPALAPEVQDYFIALNSPFDYLDFDLIRKCAPNQQEAIIFIISHQLLEISKLEIGKINAHPMAIAIFLQEIKKANDYLIHFMKSITIYDAKKTAKFLPFANHFIASLDLGKAELKIHKSIGVGLAAAIAHYSGLENPDKDLLNRFGLQIEDVFNALITCNKKEHLPLKAIANAVLLRSKLTETHYEGCMLNPLEANPFQLGFLDVRTGFEGRPTGSLFSGYRSETYVKKYLVDLAPLVKAKDVRTTECILMMLFENLFHSALQQMDKLTRNNIMNLLYSERKWNPRSYFYLFPETTVDGVAELMGCRNDEMKEVKGLIQAVQMPKVDADIQLPPLKIQH